MYAQVWKIRHCIWACINRVWSPPWPHKRRRSSIWPIGWKLIWNSIVIHSRRHYASSWEKFARLRISLIRMALSLFARLPRSWWPVLKMKSTAIWIWSSIKPKMIWADVDHWPTSMNRYVLPVAIASSIHWYVHYHTYLRRNL